MKLINMVSCAMLSSAAMLTHPVEAATAENSAEWMSGEFGIGWRFDPGNPPTINNLDVTTFVNQIKSIPRVKYVIMNLSDAAFGDLYLSPHYVLSNLDIRYTPLANNRDLFGELLDAFNDEGIKVIAYIACQGPAMLKHGASKAQDKVLQSDGTYTSEMMDAWAAYVLDEYGSNDEETLKRAFAEKVFGGYANRFGTKISGWWLDNGSENYDSQLLYQIAKQHNPNVVVCSNDPEYMDLTNGHPWPLGGTTPTLSNDYSNWTKLLVPIEESIDGYIRVGDDVALGHMFMPIHEKWNGGDIVWTEAEGVEWQTRCMEVGGAWTWNVDYKNYQSILNEPAIELIKDIVAQVPDVNNSQLVQIRKRNALDYCLNGGGADPFPAQNVKLWSYSPDHVAMTWEEIDRGNGFYSYQKKGTNFSLDGGNGGVNQQNVYLWKTDSDNYNQQWQKINVGGGYFKLKKRNAAYGINGGNGGANLQNVNLWKSSSSSQNLQWKIEYR